MYRLLRVTTTGDREEWRVNHQKRFGTAYFATSEGRTCSPRARNNYWLVRSGYWTVNTKKDFAHVVMHLNKLRSHGLVKYIVFAPIKES